jgi:hypothetical protein
MTIITLGSYHSMLSYRLAPTDGPFVQHRRHVGSGATCILIVPHLSSGVGLESLDSLMSFSCEDTYHMTNLDPSSHQNRTYT